MRPCTIDGVTDLDWGLRLSVLCRPLNVLGEPTGGVGVDLHGLHAVLGTGHLQRLLLRNLVLGLQRLFLLPLPCNASLVGLLRLHCRPSPLLSEAWIELRARGLSLLLFLILVLQYRVEGGYVLRPLMFSDSRNRRRQGGVLSRVGPCFGDEGPGLLSLQWLLVEVLHVRLGPGQVDGVFYILSRDHILHRLDVLPLLILILQNLELLSVLDFAW